MTRHLVLATVLLTILVSTSCAPSNPEVCTPDTAGKGSARRLARRDLPSPPLDGTVCRTESKIIRTPDQLRAAYEALQLPQDPLPAVDFTKESVVVFSSQKSQGVSWVVAEADTITFGIGRCIDAGFGCNNFVFAVDAPLDKVEAFTCEEASCSTPSNNNGG